MVESDAPITGKDPAVDATTSAPHNIQTSRAPRPARARILAAASRLFYARGIRAVGVDTLIAESGVAKATFYKHFPAKVDLVLAYLDQIDADWSAQLHGAAEAAGPEPAEQLVGLFDALSATCRTEGYRGCGFLNAAAESLPGSAVHERTVAHKHAVRSWVRELASCAGASDPDRLAYALTLVLDGALAAGALDADPAVADAARHTARDLVASAVPTH